MKNLLHRVGVGMMLVWAAQGRGQNLVPNPSFEVLDSCPDYESEIQAATPWQTFRGSVDLYHVCSTGFGVDVPLNFAGYQLPYDGDGYAGLITCLTGDTLHREFMGAELITPLTPGIPVFVSFRMAVGGWGLYAPVPDLSSSGIGVFFSMTAFLQYNLGEPLPGWTAVACATAPTDTASWILVSGVFIPDSAFTQVLVGNPLNYSELSVVVLDSSSGVSTMAYAFVDAICVSEVEGVCPMALGQVDHFDERPIALYPNPCSDRVTLTVSSREEVPDRYVLFDMRGAVVARGDLNLRHGSVSLSPLDWPVGVFSFVTYANSIPVSKEVLVHLNP